MTDVNKLIELELLDRKLREEMSRQMGRPVVGSSSFIVTDSRGVGREVANTAPNTVAKTDDTIFDP